MAAAEENDSEDWLDSDNIIRKINKCEIYLPKNLTFEGCFDAIGKVNHSFSPPQIYNEEPSFAVYCTTKQPKDGHWIVSKNFPSKNETIVFDSSGQIDERDDRFTLVLKTIKKKYRSQKLTTNFGQCYQHPNSTLCGGWVIGYMSIPDFENNFIPTDPTTPFDERKQTILSANERKLVKTLYRQRITNR